LENIFDPVKTGSGQQNKMKKNSTEYLTDGKPFIILLAIFITAFFFRYFFANVQIITNDGILYIKIAKSISAGDLQDIADYGFFNLYSFLIALFQIIFRNWEFSGKMVSVIFGSLTVIPLFFLLRGLFNKNIAIVSALLYGVHPRFVEYSSDVLREPVFWFFSITALWLAWEGISRRKCLPFVLSSMSTGFAIFTRSEGIMIFLVVVLWIMWFFLNDKKNNKKALIYACIFLFSLPILSSPGLILLKNKLNRWEVGLSISKVHQLMFGNSQSSDLKLELSGQTSDQIKTFVDLFTRHQYTTFLMEVLYKFIKSFNIILFILFLCGVYKRRFITYSQNDILVLIWFSVTFIGSFLYLTKTYYLGTRHGLLMAFPALAWAGIGFFEIRDRIRKWYGSMKLFQRYAHLDTLFLIIFILIVLVPQTVFSYRYDKLELKKAGIELKKMGFSNTTYIVQPNLSRVAFYADAEFVSLPDKIDNVGIKTLAVERHATLLIIDDRTIDNYFPGIRKILEQSKFEKLTTPEIDQYCNYSFSIYKIK
jgi:4-amino-4-deoxy-L-arabinose transferase-like glycosyltransferase